MLSQVSNNYLFETYLGSTVMFERDWACGFVGDLELRLESCDLKENEKLVFFRLRGRP